MRLPPPNFNGYQPGPDFDQALEMMRTPFQYMDVPLDNALVNAIYDISGDFLYVDASSTGTATIELNNQYTDPAAPFLIQPGFALAALFKQIKVSAIAQPGKKIRFLYSTGDRVVPTNSVSINGGVTVTASGNTYGASYKSITPMAANTPDTIFTPAANVNGAIVWDARFMESHATAAWSQNSYLAKASAPATVIDGDIVVGVDSVMLRPLDSAVAYTAGRLLAPVKIPAGKGLYYISTLAEGVAQRSALYTLL